MNRTGYLLAAVCAFLLALPFSLLAESSVQGMQEVAHLSVTAEVAPYTTVKLSTNEITFDVRGEPGEYFSKETVEVRVGSNQSKWSVYLKASGLTPIVDGVRPLSRNRLAFSRNNDGQFLGLKQDQILLQGNAAQIPTPMTLRFRLLTTWEDRPGTYKGRITFAFMANP